MSANSSIEWCHHTVNFWWGCARVSPACEHCYAESWAKYASKGRVSWGTHGKRWLRVEEATRELLALERSAARRGVRERVFINSMSDTFEDRRDLDAPRRALLELVPQVPHVDLLLLTKRPECVLRFLREHTDHEVVFTGADFVASEWLAGRPPANVWIGTTVEDQARADERIPELVKIPAAVRFLSCEPLLGSVDVARWLVPDTGLDYVGETRHEREEEVLSRCIDWMIAGGESGPKARPMHPAWARSLRDQCAAAGVPFFFKQWGEWCPLHALEGDPIKERVIAGDGSDITSHPIRQDHTAARMFRVGKKAAGRLLDGRLHDAFPASLLCPAESTPNPS